MFWQKKNTQPGTNEGMQQGMTVQNVKMMAYSGMATCGCVARFSRVVKRVWYFPVSMSMSVGTSACLTISTC